MSLIQIQDLTFAYDGSYDTIFEHVNLQLDTRWRLGLVGRNGRGKTTLLRLLQGQLEHRGTISAPGVRFVYFPMTVADDTALTMDALERLCPDCPRWRLERDWNLLRLKEDALYQPFYTLSKGEQTKALLAALFQIEGCFPLIDEPTNHLDLEGRRVVAEYLKGQNGFILVSHDRAFLDGCVDHILSINRADIEVQRGNFTSWWHNQELRNRYERSESERLKKDVKRLEAATRRTAGWSDEVEKTKKGTRNSGLRPDRGYIGHKAAKMMKRARQIEERREAALEEKASLLKNEEKAEPLKLHPLSYHSRTLVEARQLTLSYGDKAVCRDVSFTVEQGERVALRGGNGSGKSSLLSAIRGADIVRGGTLTVGSGLKLSYVPQSAGHLCGTLTDFAASRSLDESLLKAILRKLDFSRLQFEKDMADFSGGQKKKVLLAASLCERAHLYLWDEPLNFVDVLSRMQLEQLLLEKKPTILFVEHDRAFAERVATKTVFLSP